MTNLYSFIPGSLKRPLSELFLTDASLWNQWNQYKFIAFNPIQNGGGGKKAHPPPSVFPL